MPFFLLLKRQNQEFLGLRTSQTLTIAVVDRRTGKTIYNHVTPSLNDQFTVKLNPEKNRAEYEFREFTLRVNPLDKTSSETEKKTVNAIDDQNLEPSPPKPAAEPKSPPSQPDQPSNSK
ncbi:MAG: hypothetical protein R3C11_12220 [Planctomycetaceae bacterium]